MTWNPDFFSSIGYLGLAASGLAVVLLIGYLVRPNRLVCTAFLFLALSGWYGARVNSSDHVNMIQPDRTEELKKRAELEAARRNALVESRGEEVADVRFVEDGTNDFLDRAGMDEADLKYFESQGGFGDPDWKKNKKERTAVGADDDGLESAIDGGGEVIEGVAATGLDEEEIKDPIVMVEADLVMANRLDLLNLRITLVLVIAAIILLAFDYLRRANQYGKSSYPLPLPSRWLNAITPMAPVVISSKRCRRSARSELARLARRGDSFLYLTDDPARLAKLPSSFAKLRLTGWREEVIPVTDAIEADFIFETVWYGRSSFVVGEREQALALLGSFLKTLGKRQSSRARVRQTAHLVWDLEESMPPDLREEAVRLAAATGFSLLVLRENREKKPPASPTQDISKEAPVPS